MLKNRFGMASSEEKYFYAALGAFIAFFFFIMTKLVFKYFPEINGIITKSGLENFNFLISAIIHAVFLPSIAIEAFGDATALYRNGETPFLLQFPIGNFRFFVFRFFLKCARLSLVFFLLYPFLIIYFFYFSQTGAYKCAAVFPILFFTVIFSLLFFSSLLILFSSVITRALSRFKHDILLAAVFLIITASMIFSYGQLKGGVKDNDGVGIDYSVNTSAVVVCIKNSPVTALLNLTAIKDSNAAPLLYSAAVSLFIIFLTFLASFLVSNSLVINDIGQLNDNVHLRQSSSKSLGYFYPIRDLPHLFRAVIYEQVCYIRRRLSAFFIAVSIPFCAVMPFFVPDKFLNKLLEGDFRPPLFLIAGVLLLSMLEYSASNIFEKPCFLDIIKPMPIRVRTFLSVKSLFYSILFAAAMLIISPAWLFKRAETGDILEVIVTFALWGTGFSFFSIGFTCFFRSMINSSSFSDRSVGSDINDSVSGIVVGIFTLMPFMAAVIGLRGAAFLFFMAVWFLISAAMFNKGCENLEKLEL